MDLPWSKPWPPCRRVPRSEGSRQRHVETPWRGRIFGENSDTLGSTWANFGMKNKSFSNFVTAKKRGWAVGSHVQHVATWKCLGSNALRGGGGDFCLTLQKYHSFLRLQSQSHICLIWDRWVVFNIKFLSFEHSMFGAFTHLHQPFISPTKKGWHSSTQTLETAIAL